MIGLYHTVRGDLFDIARRLKEVDKDYFVVYSYRANRYEVHSKGNKGNTFCFATPRLDGRVIVRARQTRRERLDRLIAEAERDNELVRREAVYQTIKKIERGAETALSQGG